MVVNDEVFHIPMSYIDPNTGLWNLANSKEVEHRGSWRQLYDDIKMDEGYTKVKIEKDTKLVQV